MGWRGAGWWCFAVCTSRYPTSESVWQMKLQMTTMYMSTSARSEECWDMSMSTTCEWTANTLGA